MLLEGAEASFERMEHRLRQLRGLARVKRVLEHYALAKDMALQVGDVPVGLGKMLLFLSHRFCADNKKPGRESCGACLLAFCASRYSELPRLRYRLKRLVIPMIRAWARKRQSPLDAPLLPQAPALR